MHLEETLTEGEIREANAGLSLQQQDAFHITYAAEMLMAMICRREAAGGVEGAILMAMEGPWGPGSK